MYFFFTRFDCGLNFHAFLVSGNTAVTHGLRDGDVIAITGVKVSIKLKFTRFE